MSYNVYMEYPPCPTCMHAPSTDFLSWNYTSNCGPMWRTAGADLAEFHGKAAGDCANILADAIATMEREPERFRAMNPSNRWGSYDSLVPALKELLAAFQAAPTAIVKVSLSYSPLPSDSGTEASVQESCQHESLQFARPAGTQIADKDRATPPPVMGQEGGTEVRTLSYEPSPENKTEALLALLEQPSVVGAEADSVTQFVMEHGLEPGRAHGATMYDLYRMYEAWAEGEARDPRHFTRRIRGMGFLRGPRLAAGKKSYAVLMGLWGARVSIQWVKQNPAPYGYGKQFRQRLLMGHK